MKYRPPLGLSWLLDQPRAAEIDLNSCLTSPRASRAVRLGCRSPAPCAAPGAWRPRRRPTRSLIPGHRARMEHELLLPRPRPAPTGSTPTPACSPRAPLQEFRGRAAAAAEVRIAYASGGERSFTIDADAAGT
jgi:hypothetical protein